MEKHDIAKVQITVAAAHMAGLPSLAEECSLTLKNRQRRNGERVNALRREELNVFRQTFDVFADDVLKRRHAVVVPARRAFVGLYDRPRQTRDQLTRETVLAGQMVECGAFVKAAHMHAIFDNLAETAKFKLGAGARD